MRGTQLHRLRIAASSSLLAFTASSCAHTLNLHRADIGSANDSVTVARSEAGANTDIPVGVAMGVVVDARSGIPIRFVALEILRNDSSMRGLRAITDENGLFTIKAIPQGAVRLRATLIGYERQELALSGDSGFVVRMGMLTQPVQACGMQVPAGEHSTIPAVAVIVRDARTGMAPTTAVTLRIRDHDFVDSVGTAAPEQIPRDSVELGAAPYRQGAYEVEVTAPNYRAFHVPSVSAKHDSCNQSQGRRLNVWLLPKS